MGKEVFADLDSPINHYMRQERAALANFHVSANHNTCADGSIRPIRAEGSTTALRMNSGFFARRNVEQLHGACICQVGDCGCATWAFPGQGLFIHNQRSRPGGLGAGAYLGTDSEGNLAGQGGIESADAADIDVGIGRIKSAPSLSAISLSFMTYKS